MGELLTVVDDDANPRVQTHGAAALVNFSEDCPKPILVLYIDAIMNKLERVLSVKMKEVCDCFIFCWCLPQIELYKV